MLIKMHRNRLGQWSGLLLLQLFLLAPLARPQATTGTILGTVHDASGAVVAGAHITVTNTDTKVSSSWVSNSEGDFTAPFQLPGQYEVTVDHPGFKKVVRSGITLEVAARARVDVTLEVGVVSETVTATAEAPLVRADSSEVAQVIQEKAIQELPLNSSTGRNFTALMTLVPGTIRTNPVGVFDSPQGNSSFVVNGTRDSANNYMIDGADNNESLLGIVAILPPPEALSEFNIQTSNYAAEFGRAGGAVINVMTRSGSNSVHASLYEFLRNSALDARGPFDRANLPPLRQNEFGGTLGGPIIKNHTFFFVDYVGFRQRAGQTYTTTVPTLAQRQGVFLASEGAPTIYNPFTHAPFANNTIPASLLNPITQKIISFYPAPNLPGNVVANQGVTNNYSGVSVQQQDSTRVDLRIDHKFSDRDTLFGRYSIFDAYTALPPLFGNIATGSTPSRSGKGDARNQSIIISDVHTFSPTKLNELRLSYNRIANSFTGFDYGSDIGTSLGIPNSGIFGAISSGLPNIVITGLGTNLGTDAPIPALRYEGTAQIVDNFSIFAGKHSFKFGGDLRRYRGDFFQISLSSPRGEFDFDQNFTSNNGQAGTGLGIASFLLGYASAEARGVIYDFPSNVSGQYFFYAQDDYKVSAKLTVNIGLRYEIYTPTVDRHDNQSNFNTRTGQVELAGRGGNSRSLVNNHYNYWAPRFGLAYSVTPKTVIRTGYGLSYFPDKFGSTGGTLNTNYPFITLQQVTAPDRYNPTATTLISNGIPVPSRPNLSGPSVPLVGNILAFDPNYQMGYFQFWNFTIQRQLGRQMVAEVAYVGTKGTHLYGNQHANLNEPDPGPGAIDPRRPYYSVAPLAGTIYLRDSSEWSNYHALQAKFEKRFGSGLSFLNSYAFAKAMDDAATSPDVHNWDLFTRGPSNNDFRHNFTTSVLYELPFGRGRRFGTDIPRVVEVIAGGWQVNGIYTFRTGLPVTASLTSGLVASTLNTGWTGRPDQIAPANLPNDQRTLARYFNTAAFAAPPANSYRYGNAGRNTIRGPNFSSLDFSLFKNFHFTERVNLQFRSEFFNLPNHPNYGNPSGSFGSAAFGTITSLASNMRQIQFGLKLLF